MIEVVHYTNRYGRQKVGVWGVSSTDKHPEQVKYDQRYAAGLEPAFFPLPVPLKDSAGVVFALRYFTELLKEILVHV